MSSPPEINLQNEKGSINVIILGPYGECLPVLLEVRDFLREKGYVNTFLVSDLPDIEEIPDESRDVYFLEKSHFYIREFAQIILFLFLDQCNCESVLTELLYTANNVNEKCDYSTILHSAGREFSSLVRGTIQVHRISVSEFRDQEQLNKIAFASCFNSLSRLSFRRLV